MSDPDRRAFLRWMAASPLAASLAGCGAEPGTGAPSGAASRPDGGAPGGGLPPAVTRPEDALDLFDLERVAAGKVPPAHWGYLQTGTDDETTLRRNREGFGRLHVRPRRLAGVAELDTRVEIFGRSWPWPLLLAPAGSQRGFHPDGEGATARACAETDTLFVLSNVASTAVEEVNEARGEPVWFQLYPSGAWEVTHHVVRRAEAAGCPVLVVTVDNPGGANRITAERAERTDPRSCGGCHVEGGQAPPTKPNYSGAPSVPGAPGRDSLTWDFIDRLREATAMKLVLKGIVTGQDARRALDHGADAVWVSNHGGRTDPSGQATIEALPEVTAAVAGRAPVILDSGVRRGSDVFKALALGADAVAVGRPYLWGLGAFGEAGVARAVEILRRELELTLRAAGAPTLAGLGPDFVGREP